jgi:hypothetical protein
MADPLAPEPSSSSSDINPMARINPSPDNPRGYPTYNITHISSYTTNQIDYYRRTVPMTTTESKSFIDAIKSRKELLDLLNQTGLSEDEGEQPRATFQPQPRTPELSVTTRSPLRSQSKNLDTQSALTTNTQQTSVHTYDDEEPDSDCPPAEVGVKYQKFNVKDTAQLKYDSNLSSFQIWLSDQRNVFESNPAMFPNSRQKIIRATLTMEEKLRAMHANIIQAYPKLRSHWRKFLRWLTATVLRGEAKKDPAVRAFTTITQGWTEDPYVFFQKLLTLATQTNRKVTIDNFVTSLSSPLQSELKIIRMLKRHTTVHELVDDAAQIWATRKPEQWKAMAVAAAGTKSLLKWSLTKGEREYRQKHNLCFNCGFPGHSAADCKNKFNSQRVLQRYPKADPGGEGKDKPVQQKKRVRIQAVEIDSDSQEEDSPNSKKQKN